MSAFEPDSAQPNGLDKLGTALAGTITSGFAFNANNERGVINNMFIKDASITDAKIANLTFNKAVGGTLTLGGTANGNGYGQVLDSSGGTVITLTNTGINVYGGNINVYDSSGGTVIDSLGLNSTNNFYSDSVSGGVFDTTSTSMVNVTGGTLATLVFTRPTKCLVYISINGENQAASEDCRATVYDTYSSGTLNNFVANFNGQYDGTAYFNQLVTIQRTFTLAAGTHNLNLQVKASGGTAHIAGWELGLLKLGN
jgi:hypothetical protein